MATYPIYSYRISDPRLATQLFPGSIAISVRVGERSLRFIYYVDGEIEAIQPVIGAAYSYTGPTRYTDFFKDIGHREVIVETAAPHHTLQPTTVVHRISWSKTIDDLAAKLLVQVEPSQSFMCTDQRRFRFGNDEEWWEVDCLGTGMCPDITERVKDLWCGAYH